MLMLSVLAFLRKMKVLSTLSNKFSCAWLKFILLHHSQSPHDFNKEVLFNTLDELYTLDLKYLALAHFGIHKNPYELIINAKKTPVIKPKALFKKLF